MSKTCNHPRGITCPKCNAPTRVPQSRAKHGGMVLRYRVCIKGCPGRLVTRETIIKLPK
jgi:transcriptional regulator NrdR family protein